MGRKKGVGAAVEQTRPFCFYCDRTFDDETVLLQHQRAKHFRCPECDDGAIRGKCESVQGLIVHTLKVHGKGLARVPNALQGRDNPDLNVYGMDGIPAEVLRQKGYGEIKFSTGQQAPPTKVTPPAAQPPAAPEMLPPSGPGMQMPPGMLPPGMHPMPPGMAGMAPPEFAGYPGAPGMPPSAFPGMPPGAPGMPAPAPAQQPPGTLAGMLQGGFPAASSTAPGAPGQPSLQGFHEFLAQQGLPPPAAQQGVPLPGMPPFGATAPSPGMGLPPPGMPPPDFGAMNMPPPTVGELPLPGVPGSGPTALPPPTHNGPAQAAPPSGDGGAGASPASLGGTQQPPALLPAKRPLEEDGKDGDDISVEERRARLPRYCAVK